MQIKIMSKRKDCKNLLNHNFKHIRKDIFICQDCKSSFRILLYPILNKCSIYTQSELYKKFSKDKILGSLYKSFSDEGYYEQYAGQPSCKDAILESVLQ
jgi:hypothetical protein